MGGSFCIVIVRYRMCRSLVCICSAPQFDSALVLSLPLPWPVFSPPSSFRIPFLFPSLASLHSHTPFRLSPLHTHRATLRSRPSANANKLPLRSAPLVARPRTIPLPHTPTHNNPNSRGWVLREEGVQVRAVRTPPPNTTTRKQTLPGGGGRCPRHHHRVGTRIHSSNTHNRAPMGGNTHLPNTHNNSPSLPLTAWARRTHQCAWALPLLLRNSHNPHPRTGGIPHHHSKVARTPAGVAVCLRSGEETPRALGPTHTLPRNNRANNRGPLCPHPHTGGGHSHNNNTLRWHPPGLPHSMGNHNTRTTKEVVGVVGLRGRGHRIGQIHPRTICSLRGRGRGGHISGREVRSNNNTHSSSGHHTRRHNTHLHLSNIARTLPNNTNSPLPVRIWGRGITRLKGDRGITLGEEAPLLQVGVRVGRRFSTLSRGLPNRR